MKLFKRSRSVPQQSHKVQLAKRDGYRSKVIEKTADEYEYVPRDYGYDYAPPSLRVPAHSTSSSTIQHHLSSMIYSEEPLSDISGNAPSAHSARHIDYKVQKPTSKSHWRPSEKEQRQIISEEQKRRRVEKIKEFQRLHGHRPASYIEERELPQSSHTQRHRSGKDNIRQNVERVLTAHDYQSVDSALHVAEEKNLRARYSTGQTVNSRIPSSRQSSQRRDDRYAMSSRSRSDTGSRRSRRSYESRDTDEYGSHPQDKRQQRDGHSKSSTTKSVHDRHILSYHPSHGSTEQQKADARERKRSIERSFGDYLIREGGWVPTEIVRAQAVPPMNTSPQLSVKEAKRVAIAPTVPKKRGLFKRIFGIGKGKKKSTTVKQETKTTQPALQSKGTVTKYQPSQSYMKADLPNKVSIKGESYPASANSSTTQALSYSTGPGYDHYEPLQSAGTNRSGGASLRSSSLSNPHQKLHQSSNSDYGYRGGSFRSRSSSSSHPKLPQNAIRVLPPFPPHYHRDGIHPQMQVRKSFSGSQKASSIPSSGGAWAPDPRAPVPVAYRASDRLALHQADYRLGGSRNRAPTNPPAAPACLNFSCV
jgi:hypothetical protein